MKLAWNGSVVPRLGPHLGAESQHRRHIDTFMIHNVNGGYDIQEKIRHFRKFTLLTS